MKYEELRPQIQTGDLMLVDGKGFVSDVIKAATDGRFSHVGVFFRMGDGIFVAETYEGEGFNIKPASQRLAQVTGKVYLGIAPAVVRSNPDKIMAEISEFRVTPSLQPYGYGTLAPVLAACKLGLDIDPNKVQAVCSTFAERCYIRAGMTFPSLLDPSDYDTICAGVVQIDI